MIGDHDDDRVSARLVITVAAVAAAAATTALFALGLWVVTLRQWSQPGVVHVMACTPGTATADECQTPFRDGGGRVVIGDGVPIARLVCNESGRDLAYQVTVTWNSVSLPAAADGLGVTFAALDAPVVFDEGCEVPFLFTYKVPAAVASLFESIPSGESLGFWRLTGQAVPIGPGSPRSDRIVRWDVTDTFELIQR